MSRTIADLEDAQSIEMHHVAEAINYRAFDRKLFGEISMSSIQHLLVHKNEDLFFW